MDSAELTVEIAKQIVELAKAASWPLVVIVLAITFRREIRSLLNRKFKFSGLGVAGEWGDVNQQAAELKEEVAEIQKESPATPSIAPKPEGDADAAATADGEALGDPDLPPSSRALDEAPVLSPTRTGLKYGLLVPPSPSASNRMISAWSRLDSTVGEAIARYGLDPGITTLEMLGNLNLTNVISADTLRMAEEANAIVAQVMLGGKLISHAGARKFTQSVDEIIKRVRVEANLDATPIKPRD